MIGDRVFAAIAIGMLAGLVACDNMANQPKRLPYEQPYGATALWPVLPPPHVVARDDQPVPPPPVTEALLRRGQQRFDIYCAPCHGRTGDGGGIVVARGFPAPPSYFTERLRDAAIGHFYDVITHGHGAMFSYADRVSPADRWAIVAYIRALQASMTAHVAELSPEARRALR
jgi:mono/diheme cytochrome c family protein